MKFIGTIGTDLSVKKHLISRVTEEGWGKISRTSDALELSIHYDQDSNTRSISTEDKIILCDDNLFCMKNNSLGPIDDRELISLFNENGIEGIRSIQSNVKLAFYDIPRNCLYLASNRLAAGRMYYLFWEGSVFFSNDFTLLARLKGLSLHDIAIHAYSRYGAVPEDITFDREIRSVPPSHYARIHFPETKVHYTPFYTFDYSQADKPVSESWVLQATEDILKRNACAVSREPVHMLISGGIDSTLFAWYLKEYTTDIIGHYCRFGEHDPEEPFAQEVADTLSIPLRVHTIHDENIIEEIEDTAGNTAYPFSDFSNVSVNFLLRKIREEFGSGSVVIECNGADDAFGYAALNRIPIWKNLYTIPAPILNLLAEIATLGNIWMYDSLITQILFYILRAKGKNIYHSHSIYSAGEKVARERDHVRTSELIRMMSSFFNAALFSASPGYYEQMNTAQFFHVCSRLWTAKGYTPAERMNLKIIYPFTWKNVLDIQARIPREMKIHNGIVKWPLKKLCEQYMPHEFIYRKKSGFAPPLLRWLREKRTFEYVYIAIMNSELIRFLKKNKIEKLLNIAISNASISRYGINLIWSLLFFEVWIKNNHIDVHYT